MGEGAGLMDLVAASWKPDGVRISPVDLMQWTPHHIYGVFYLDRAKANSAPDNVAILAKHNQTRAANNQRPVAPSWFLSRLRSK